MKGIREDSVILSHQITAEEKKERLGHTYGIAKGAVTAEQSAAIQMLKDGLKPEKIVTYLSTLTITDVENIAKQF